MNRITPIVLLLIVVAAGFYVTVFEVRPGAAAPDTTLVFPGVTNAEAETVSEVTVTRGAEELGFLRGRDGAWRMVRPVEGFARDIVINNLIHDMLFLHRTGGLIAKDQISPTGLGAYGLAKPRVTVTLRAGKAETAKEWRLQIGSADPTKQYAYVKAPLDTGVSIVEHDVVEAFAAPIAEWRERKFLRFDMNHVTAMSLRSPQAKLEIRKAGTSWVVTKPFSDRVDWLRFETVLRALNDLEARDFKAESVGNLEVLGLEGSRVRVEVSFTRDDNSTTTLFLGAPCKDPVGTVYAKLDKDSTVYAVDDALEATLTFPSDALRERRFLPISSYAATEFSVEKPGLRLAVKKEGTKWKISDPVTADAEDGEVDNFFRDVSGLEVLRWPNDAPDNAALERYGLDAKSRTTVTIRQADKPPVVFFVGKVDPKEKDLYVQRAGVATIYTIPETFSARTTGNWLDFRARKVASFSKYDAQKLVLHRPSGDVTLEKGADTKWRLTAPAAGPGDEVDIGNVLDDLNDLSAVKFLAQKPANPAEFGLDKPAYEVSVELKAGKDKPVETKTVLLGKPVGTEGWTAEVKGDDLVWQASNVFVEHLNAEMRKRLVWEVRRADIQSVTWQAGADKAVVRPEAGWWKLVEPANRKLDMAAVDEMISPLENLRVDKFESYSKDNLTKYGLDKPRASVTLVVDGRDRSILIGADKDKDFAWATISTDEVVFALPRGMAAAMMRGPLAPVEPTPAPAPVPAPTPTPTPAPAPAK